MAPSAVHAHGVTLGYASRPNVVHDLDLELGEGETVAIVGPSGGGKTTILKAVAGLLAPTTGRLSVLGWDHPKRPPRGHVGYVPQRLGLVGHATATSNALLGNLPRTGTWRSLIGIPTREGQQAAAQALERVGLGEHAHERVGELSGGQQRRVALARALVQRPRLLVADEILGELDPQTARTVVAAVKDLQRETRMSVLLVEHDLDTALDIADRVLVLQGRRLRPWAAPETEVNRPAT